MSKLVHKLADKVDKLVRTLLTLCSGRAESSERRLSAQIASKSLSHVRPRSLASLAALISLTAFRAVQMPSTRITGTMKRTRKPRTR